MIWAHGQTGRQRCENRDLYSRARERDGEIDACRSTKAAVGAAALTDVTVRELASM